MRLTAETQLEDAVDTDDCEFTLNLGWSVSSVELVENGAEVELTLTQLFS